MISLRAINLHNFNSLKNVLFSKLASSGEGHGLLPKILCPVLSKFSPYPQFSLLPIWTWSLVISSKSFSCKAFLPWSFLQLSCRPGREHGQVFLMCFFSLNEDPIAGYAGLYTRSLRSTHGLIPYCSHCSWRYFAKLNICLPKRAPGPAVKIIINSHSLSLSLSLPTLLSLLS